MKRDYALIHKILIYFRDKDGPEAGIELRTRALSGLRPLATVWGAREAPGPTDIRGQGTTEKPTSVLTREAYSTTSEFHAQRIRARVRRYCQMLWIAA